MTVRIYYSSEDFVHVEIEHTTLAGFVDDFMSRGWWFTQVSIMTKIYVNGKPQQEWALIPTAIPWHAVTKIEKVA